MTAKIRFFGIIGYFYDFNAPVLARIYLIGYMASGKSRMGNELAKRLGRSFLDLDELFETRYRISIPDFFEKYSERQFRFLEQRLLYETVSLDHSVIATGGGTPCFSDNMDWMKQAGTTVYLKTDPAVLIGRLQHPGRKRPVLKDFSPAELPAVIRSHLHEREGVYEQADYILTDADDGMEKLVSWLEKNER